MNHYSFNLLWLLKNDIFELQGRVDDNIDTIKKRLYVFKALNLPVVDYYSKKGKLHTVII